MESLAAEFFRRATAEQLAPEDVFRITITSFLDAYNFDVRRLMKCCIHHVLPSGHVIPFCAYNVLYRNGHVPLPTLRALTSLNAEAPSTARGSGTFFGGGPNGNSSRGEPKNEPDPVRLRR